MAYDRDEIFQAVGKFIARFNFLETVKASLETVWTQQIGELNESDETRALLERAADTQVDQQDTIDDMKAAVKADITEYITTELREMLDVVPANDVVAVLDALQDAMYLADDTVFQQTHPAPVAIGSGEADTRFDIDNAGVGRIGWIYFHDQQTHDDVEFLFKCISITGVIGAETWSLSCKKSNGTVEELSTFISGDSFQSEKYGLDIAIVPTAAIEEGGDGANQLDNWVLAGATKRKGDEYTEPIQIANASWYGLYHVKLFDVAGTRTVELYRDSGLTEKVAEGSRVGDGAIALAAVGGSGLTGSVDVAYTGDDNTITLKYPFEIAVGDKATFISDVTVAKLFQTFFVEEYDKALPASGAPTVLEVWATIV